MIDSWIPRKLEAGLAAIYSIPSDLITSTMKSPPLRPSVSCSFAGIAASAAASWIGTLPLGATGGVTAALAKGGAMVAAPTRLAPFKKPRRPTPLAVLPFLISSSELALFRNFKFCAVQSPRAGSRSERDLVVEILDRRTAL